MKMHFHKKEPNCSGTAFVQGDSAGGSKLIEQTLSILDPTMTTGIDNVFQCSNYLNQYHMNMEIKSL